jgi:cobalamin biosynthesis protein CbiG
MSTQAMSNRIREDPYKKCKKCLEITKKHHDTTRTRMLAEVLDAINMGMSTPIAYNHIIDGIMEKEEQ